MKKQIILSGIFVLIIFAGFCGCLKEKSKISNDESKFYGTWVGNADTRLTISLLGDPYMVLDKIESV